MTFPLRVRTLAIHSLLLAAVACGGSPTATSSGSPTAPEVGASTDKGPPLGAGPTDDLPICNWVPDKALAAEIDPDGQSPLDGVTLTSAGLVAISETKVFREGTPSWTSEDLGRGAGSAIDTVAGDPVILADADIMRFSSNKWRPDAVPGGGMYLDALAPARGDLQLKGAIAVGFKDSDAGARVALLRSNGKRWVAEKTPALGSGSTQRLNGAASNPDVQVAVGVADVKGVGQPLALWSTGRGWNKASIRGPKGSTWSELEDVTAFEGGFIAVGSSWTKNGEQASAFLSPDGRAWTSVSVPQPGISGTRGGFAPPYGAALRAVSSDGTTVIAAGTSTNPIGEGDAELVEVALVARWNGTRFVQEKVVADPNYTDPVALFDISVGPELGQTVAVGIDGTGAFIARRACPAS